MLKAALLERHRESIIPIGDRFFFCFFFCVYTNPTIWTLFHKVFQNLEVLMLLYTPQDVLAFDKIKGFFS